MIRPNPHSARAFPARLALAGFIAAGTLVPALAGADRDFLSVGTGMTGGVYFPVGAAICELVNKAAGADGLYCSPEATPGSVYNLEALGRGEIEFAVVQADNQSAAVHGEGPWAGAPMKELRSVLSLYPEAFTVLARRQAEIRSLSDLAGKRVNIGNPGSGSRATWDAVSEGLGISAKSLALATELAPGASYEELCSDGIDASVLVVGHPAPRVAEAIKDCDLVIVPADGPVVDRLVAAETYIVTTTIPAEDYGLSADVTTFGGRATLVTRADVPDATVEAVAKAVLANFPLLKEKHPVLAGLRPAEMISQSLTAPLHPGAIRAFTDLGLTPQQQGQ